MAMVRETDLKLQQDWARPIIMQARSAICIQPWAMDMTIMVNSAYNGWRFEDVWLQKKVQRP
jgi:peptide/nickel transport system substrate-binding protein